MSKATTTAAAADDELSPSAFTGMSKLRAGQDSHDLSDALIDAAGSEDGEFVAGKIRKKGFVEPERRTTWYNAAFILVAELVGTGILGLPYTFATVGWIPGVALLFVFAGLAFYSGCDDDTARGHALHCSSSLSLLACACLALDLCDCFVVVSVPAVVLLSLCCGYVVCLR